MLKLFLILYSLGAHIEGASCTLPCGRTIAVTSDSTTVKLKSTGPDTAIAHLGTRSVVVKPSEIELDGETLAIDEDAESVDVILEAEGLHVIVDGESIADIYPELKTASRTQADKAAK